MHDGVGVSFSGTYGLPSACARVTILCTQVVGHPHGRSARAPVHDPGLVSHAPLLRCIRHHPLVHLGLGLCLSLLCDHYGCSLFCLFVLSACACSSDVTVTSYSHSPSVSLRAILTQPNVLSLTRGEFSWHLPHDHCTETCGDAPTGSGSGYSRTPVAIKVCRFNQ